DGFEGELYERVRIFGRGRSQHHVLQQAGVHRRAAWIGNLHPQSNSLAPPCPGHCESRSRVAIRNQNFEGSVNACHKKRPPTPPTEFALAHWCGDTAACPCLRGKLDLKMWTEEYLCE